MGMIRLISTIFFLITVGIMLSLYNPLDRANLVSIRNSIFSLPYSVENMGKIKSKTINKKFLSEAFKPYKNLATFDDFFEYRRLRFLIKENFSGGVLFKDILSHCFRENNKYICGCSDISEVIIAFCKLKGERCFEIIKGSSHSFIYNLSRNVTIDLFYGYLFYGTPDELIQYARKGELEFTYKFVDLGQSVLISELEDIMDLNTEYSNNEDVVAFLKKTKEYKNRFYPSIKKNWNELIINVLEDPSKLSLQFGHYSWKGNERLFPIVEFSKLFGKNTQMIFKDVFGRLILRFISIDT